MATPVFYVASPLGERTAGPEALTQLVDAIRRRGVEAYLIPMRNYRGRRNDPEYDIYDFEVRESIQDPRSAYFVSSEVSPIESRREFRQVPAERTWMGWFSVNNSPDPRARYFRPSEQCCSPFPPGHVPETPSGPASWSLGVAAPGPFPILKEAARRTGGWRNPRAWAIEDISMHYARSVIGSGVSFFAQSYYAQGFVRQVLGAKAPIITDPIRVVEVSGGHRERDVVLYNKAKSWSLIDDVARLLPEVRFRAIEGMSFQEVAEALSTATVYLELGHLPGRDRMPREAAHFGTPVVCLARGAGYCWQDVPLPVEYRVPYGEGWAAVAADAVRRVLDDPAHAAEDQASYRSWVAGERGRYEAAVDEWLAAALSR
ncbi:MAG: hypothetical protein GC156_11850 [Actinomycetales bacterium]|nr:hypothetical protein [Actinomycetales bacterium]